MQIIFGNYGNNTIALIQWAHLHQKNNVYVVHVETGFAASEWQTQVKKGQALAKRYHFNAIALQANPGLPEMILDRKRFPSSQFQWCVSFLKGLPFLQWLDQMDSSCEAEIWLPSRRADSRARVHLPEAIENSDYYGGRKVVYPLSRIDHHERDALVANSGLELLTHRSLECDPCIHSQLTDFSRLSEDTISRVAALECQLQRPMFNAKHFNGNEGIRTVVKWAHLQNKELENNLETYDMGCGAVYACGE